jgi:hypothetical protein
MRDEVLGPMVMCAGSQKREARGRDVRFVS